MKKPSSGQNISKTAACLIICFFVIFPVNRSFANDDSLTLAQCYINLSLTANYFDSLSDNRISKVIPFLDSELTTITNRRFIVNNKTLYNVTYAYLYFNKTKFLFRSRPAVNRLFLLKCKKTLDTSISYYDQARLNVEDITVNETFDPFYVLVGFTKSSCYSLSNSIEALKQQLNYYFNKDIYDDFKRIFFAAKYEQKYYFDSLKYFADLYDMPIQFPILRNEDASRRYVPINQLFVSPNFNLALALDLISQYLQLSYIASGGKASIHDLYVLYNSYFSFIESLNPKDNSRFGSYYNAYISKDNFFRNELSESTCDTLYSQLQKKFPYDYKEHKISKVMRGPHTPENPVQKYYFPIPAPFPSNFISINHFRPELKTLKAVDDYIKKCFNDAGYAFRLHYYYIKYSGFAISTDLEKIDKKGAPAKPDERWNLKMSDEGKFSLYEIFKSIFFTTESDYRMMACIIAPQEVEVSNKQFSIQQMSDIINQSYKSLPLDLENVTLEDKTITILVYHFYQSDIGEVPVLEANDKLIVPEHLKKTTPLERLIN